MPAAHVVAEVGTFGMIELACSSAQQDADGVAWPSAPPVRTSCLASLISVHIGSELLRCKGCMKPADKNSLLTLLMGSKLPDCSLLEASALTQVLQAGDAVSSAASGLPSTAMTVLSELGFDGKGWPVSS
ncbi:hypothetical protein ABBQ32_005740 [Trebouxia sp. C0010 RCD-2024]